jgi:hypothetical protein
MFVAPNDADLHESAIEPAIRIDREQRRRATCSDYNVVTSAPQSSINSGEGGFMPDGVRHPAPKTPANG